MHKKIAIYVEGQTEQILLNQLLKTWWEYSGIRIENIKLVNDLKYPVPNFGSQEEDAIHFVIINVEGEGNLNSAIARRATNQMVEGFQIIALRDLDFKNIPRIEEILKKFKVALNIAGCSYGDKIELYFAVMTIEAWLLGFSEALSRWAKISETEVLNKYSISRIEEIRSPAGILALIGEKRGKNPKSHHETMALVAEIKREMIEKSYKSVWTPSFNRFWDKLISLCELP